MRWLAAGLALLAVGVATTAAFVFHAPGRLWLRVGLVCLALGSIRVIASTLDLLGVRRFAERVPPRVRNGIALLVIMVILAWIVGEVVDTLAIL